MLLKHETPADVNRKINNLIRVYEKVFVGNDLSCRTTYRKRISEVICLSDVNFTRGFRPENINKKWHNKMAPREGLEPPT